MLMARAIANVGAQMCAHSLAVNLNLGNLSFRFPLCCTDLCILIAKNGYPLIKDRNKCGVGALESAPGFGILRPTLPFQKETEADGHTTL